MAKTRIGCVMLLLMMIAPGSSQTHAIQAGAGIGYPDMFLVSRSDNPLFLLYVVS